MKPLLLVALLAAFARPLNGAEQFADRFVWIFGWNLEKDADVPAITRVLENAHEHRFNGAVVSFGLDTLCKKSPDYFRRLDQIKKSCENNGLELIPAVFSVGYGSGALAHDRNLAEGVPVANAPFLVKDGEGRLATASGSVGFKNGDFEDYAGGKFRGYDFYDQPGEVGFVDTDIKHGGKAALRLEHFTANASGHGRVMQTVTVQPHRCYRMALWVKTEGLQPANLFRVLVMGGGREIAPREFRLPPSSDWRKVTVLFNSLGFEKLSLYAGVWGGKEGKVWLDDWSVEEVGPVNVLHRPGTPVTVRSEDDAVVYVEGKDYAPLQDPAPNPWREDNEAQPLRLLSGSRIHENDRLRVSWYHSMTINDGQVSVCMAEPALYEIFDHEAKLLAERLQPRSILLNMDEIRMGGTCAACSGRNMGQLLGECITKEAAILRGHMPSTEIYIWSDMLDPNHNAHGNYYLVNGDFTGSWEHVPKNLIMAVWGGEPREQSLRFFTEHGFRSLVACYYDAENLKGVQDWLQIARPIRKVRGFMYTPWQQKYGLLGDFGDLLCRPDRDTAPLNRPAKPESAD